MNARISTAIIGIMLLGGGAAGMYTGHKRAGISAATYASRLAGRTLVSRDGRTVCCSAGSLLRAEGPYRGAAVWVLSGIDCTRCAAQQLGYWRRLAEQCGGNSGLGLLLLGIGKDTSVVTAFARRYHFPGQIQTVASLQEIGLGGAATPLSILVDSTSRIVLASGDPTLANPHPLHLLELSHILSSCESHERETSSAARAVQGR